MAGSCAREEKGVVPCEADCDADKAPAVCRLTPSLLAALTCASPTLRGENRISISTDASDAPAVPLRKPQKVWRLVKSPLYARLYTPMPTDQKERLSGSTLRLESVYSQLEEEIEAFSITECKQKTRECVLAQVPIGSSLMRRRGLKAATSV